MMRGAEEGGVSRAGRVLHSENRASAIRHVVFDFDGTLADTLHLVTDIYNGLAAEHGLRTVTPAAKLSLARKTPGEVLRELETPLHWIPFIAASILERMRRRIGEALPFEGVLETCRRLHESGINLHIVSSNSPDNIHAFLARHGLQYFEEIVSGGAIFGKHRLLKRLLEKLGETAESAVYVGDEVRDIAAARRIHMSVIAVRWGYSHPEILSRHAPDHLVSRPAEIAEILGLT